MISSLNQTKIRRLTAILAITALISGCQFNLKEIKSNHEVQAELPIGISYLEKTIDEKTLQIVTIDPQKYQLSIVENEAPPDSKSLQKIHQGKHSLVTFNGSFFDEDFRPTGLLISSSKEISAYRKGKLINGIFAIDQKGLPKLYSAEKFNNQNQSFAIQNGPILLDEQAQVVVDKDLNRSAGRTVLGINKDNQIVLVLLRQSLLNQDNEMTLTDFASLLANNEYFRTIGLHSVLNLDGGPSTGLAIQDKYFPELSKVQNVIITTAKNT